MCNVPIGAARAWSDKKICQHCLDVVVHWHYPAMRDGHAGPTSGGEGGGSAPTGYAGGKEWIGATYLP